MDNTRYNEGKIYVLLNNVDNEFYVGSTSTSLDERLKRHICSASIYPTRKIYNHMNRVGFHNVCIVLIENYSCQDKTQLEVRERQWIDELKPTLNTNTPCKILDTFKIKLSPLSSSKVHRTRLIIQTQGRAFNDEQIHTDSVYVNSVNMDIDKATNLLTNDEQLKTLTDQLQGLKLQPSTNIKDLFTSITQNPLEWLKCLPKHNKTENSLRRYKTPLYTLLNNTQVKEILGAEYCKSTLKQIKQAYNNNINTILEERNKTMSVSLETNSVSSDISDNDSCAETETSEGLGIPIDELEVDTEATQKKNNNNPLDYQQQYETLNKKYTDLLSEHDNLKKQYKKLNNEYKDKALETKYSIKENEFLRELLRNLTSK